MINHDQNVSEKQPCVKYIITDAGSVGTVRRYRWYESVREGVAQEKGAAGMAFGGGFEAKHQFAPSGVAGREVIALLEPAGMRETNQGAGFSGLKLEMQVRAAPFLACFAQPVGLLVREKEGGAETIKCGALEESDLDRIGERGDVFSPPLSEAFGRGHQGVHRFGGKRDLDGVADVRHRRSSFDLGGRV